MFDVTVLSLNLNISSAAGGLRVGRAVLIAIALVLLAPVTTDALGWFTLAVSKIGGPEVLAL